MSTSPTFISGYQAAIEINAQDLTIVGRVFSLDLTGVALPKPVFGQKWVSAIVGQLSGTLSAGGHVSVEILPLLLPLLETETTLAFTIYIGEEGGTIDGGSFTGFIAPTSLSITDDAEGEPEWSYDGTTDGAVTFTPPTP